MESRFRNQRQCEVACWLTGPKAHNACVSQSPVTAVTAAAHTRVYKESILSSRRPSTISGRAEA